MTEYNSNMMPEGLQGKIDYLLEEGELKMQSQSVQENNGKIVDWWTSTFTFGWFNGDYYTHTYLRAKNDVLECTLHDVIRDFIEQYHHKTEWGWWKNE